MLACRLSESSLACVLAASYCDFGLGMVGSGMACMVGVVRGRKESLARSIPGNFLDFCFVFRMVVSWLTIACFEAWCYRCQKCEVLNAMEFNMC